MLGEVDRRRQALGLRLLTNRFGLCWQIVPRNIGELISHPKAMEAMMGMIKIVLSALEAAVRD